MDLFIFIVLILICMIASFIFGIFIGVRRIEKSIEDSSVGYLRIDRSEPDEPPKPFLEIRRGVTISDIAHKKVVMLGVINESYISHN